jgi:GMP synthase-like glutamine amidotransferase
MPPQMEQFQQALTDALKINKNLKALGVCFGHQFLANSKNIEVVTKPLNKGL